MLKLSRHSCTTVTPVQTCIAWLKLLPMPALCHTLRVGLTACGETLTLFLFLFHRLHFRSTPPYLCPATDQTAPARSLNHTMRQAKPQVVRRLLNTLRGQHAQRLEAQAPALIKLLHSAQVQC